MSKFMSSERVADSDLENDFGSEFDAGKVLVASSQKRSTKALPSEGAKRRKVTSDRFPKSPLNAKGRSEGQRRGCSSVAGSPQIVNRRAMLTQDRQFSDDSSGSESDDGNGKGFGNGAGKSREDVRNGGNGDSSSSTASSPASGARIGGVSSQSPMSLSRARSGLE